MKSSKFRWVSPEAGVSSAYSWVKLRKGVDQLQSQDVLKQDLFSVGFKILHCQVNERYWTVQLMCWQTRGLKKKNSKQSSDNHNIMWPQFSPRYENDITDCESEIWCFYYWLFLRWGMEYWKSCKLVAKPHPINKKEFWCIIWLHFYTVHIDFKKQNAMFKAFFTQTKLIIFTLRLPR